MTWAISRAVVFSICFYVLFGYYFFSQYRRYIIRFDENSDLDGVNDIPSAKNRSILFDLPGNAVLVDIIVNRNITRYNRNTYLNGFYKNKTSIRFIL